jgi:phosphonate transport system permease protein
MSAASLAGIDREWRRFTPAQRVARFAVYFVIVAAIVAAAQTIEIIPEFLADAPEQVADLLSRMWPVDWGDYADDVHGALVETLHIASLGIFGPGALAGTLAIAFRSIGFVGKLVGEALEEAQPGPIEALTATGAPWRSILLYGYWPQVKPAFWSIALFRWDINVRESAVLGLVGAGGIGMALDAALNLFQWPKVALILIAILAIVIVAEVVVTQIRKRMI